MRVRVSLLLSILDLICPSLVFSYKMAKLTEVGRSMLTKAYGSTGIDKKDSGAGIQVKFTSESSSLLNSLLLHIKEWGS